MRRPRTVLLSSLGLCGLLLVSATMSCCSVKPSYRSATGPVGTQAQGMAAVPGAMPSIDEELWVIQLPEERVGRSGDDETPGSGALVTTLPGEKRQVPVPLERTDVRAQVAGRVASTTVSQTFHNPFSEKIEAVYVFPLPENAGVNEFVMTVGERRIRGIIRDREEAQRIYWEARAQGHTASLMTQERPNIFTQRVANIEPGKRIGVEIRYFHTTPWRDGAFEYVFPMVVGPRFNPPATAAAGDGIGAAARGATGSSGQRTEVAYLGPNERSGHDVSIEVTLDAGVRIEDVRSRSHAIAVRRDSASTAQVRLENERAIPNKDFVLRWRVGDRGVESGVLTWVDPRTSQGYFSMLIVPPDSLRSGERRPMEYVFVLDCSGSMNGKPIAQAKGAVIEALGMLDDRDSFQIIRFSDSASSFASGPVPATRKNVERGRSYVRSLGGGGGTMMIEGIRAALDYPQEEGRTRVVCFMTDGYIGNEAQILGEMRHRMNGARVFSFGVGQSTNRYLLNRMAKLGNGAVAYLSLDDDAGEAMERFVERACRPALADVSVDYGGLAVSDVFPRELRDLYVGCPISIAGRFDPARSDLRATPRVLGRVDGRSVEYSASVTRVTDGSGLATVWARTKIADLMDESTYADVSNLSSRVRGLALEYGLLSAFTAFVAVDSTRVTEGSHGTTVNVPVHVPEGTRYETTVPTGG